MQKTFSQVGMAFLVISLQIQLQIMKPEPVVRYGGQKLKIRHLLSRYSYRNRQLVSSSWADISRRQRTRLARAAKAVIESATERSITNDATPQCGSVQPQISLAAEPPNNPMNSGDRLMSGDQQSVVLEGGQLREEIVIDGERQTSETDGPQPQSVPTAANSSAVPFLIILRLWAVLCKIPATQMDFLLRLLRKNSNYHEFVDLPKNWKTVVKIDKEMRTKWNVEEWGTLDKRQRFAYVGVEQRLLQYQNLYLPEGSRGKSAAY
jgi:hypothetical protein